MSLWLAGPCQSTRLAAFGDYSLLLAVSLLVTVICRSHYAGVLSVPSRPATRYTCPPVHSRGRRFAQSRGEQLGQKTRLILPYLTNQP